MPSELAIYSRLFNLTVKKTKERNMKITDNKNLSGLIVFLFFSFFEKMPSLLV
jgi:hypothetical protein